MSEKNNYGDLTRLDILLGELGYIYDSSETIKCCDEILKLKPGEAYVYYVWWYEGCTYRKIKNYEEATNCWKKALTLDSTNGGIRALKDLEYLAYTTSIKRYDKVLKHYNYALGSKNYALKTLNLYVNKEKYSWIKKGNKYIEQKLYEEAINIFDKIIHQCADIQYIHRKALLGRTTCLFELEKYKEALEYFEKGLALKHDDSTFLLGKAECLFRLKKYEEAIDCFAALLQLKECSEFAKQCGLEYQAKSYFKLNKYKKALEYYDRFLIIKSSLTALQSKAICLMQLNNFEEAFDVLNTALIASPHDIFTLHCKACCLYLLEKYEEVLKVYDETASNSGQQDSPEILEYKIIALHKLERYEEAIICQNALLMMNIKNSKALEYKASTLRQLGKQEESIKYLERAVNIDPTNKKLAISLALSQTIYLESVGRMDEALIAINKVCELTPDNIAIMVYKARICNFIGKYSEAIKYCDKVIDIDQWFIEAWEEKGIACSKLGKEEEIGKMYNALMSKVKLLDSQDKKRQEANNKAVILDFPTATKSDI
ncbi:tetratricopeptide repeat protein [Candidatus Tisiphia endosymbiont of Hybos culiciformis]|uniref:tetratricopeptide repeat protein n=1 Tax=Candidatus Tisiphia endosymbiont of Hybos culiciformis TaxID=3139331 RepID=UPI003CCAFBF9